VKFDLLTNHEDWVPRTQTCAIPLNQRATWAFIQSTPQGSNMLIEKKILGNIVTSKQFIQLETHGIIIQSLLLEISAAKAKDFFYIRIFQSTNRIGYNSKVEYNSL